MNERPKNAVRHELAAPGGVLLWPCDAAAVIVSAYETAGYLWKEKIALVDLPEYLAALAAPRG
jgi:hypothetical protein